MILNVYSLLDTKVSTFSSPFFFHHNGAAIRMCMDAGADLTTHVGRHPADFTLFLLGQFDDQLGTFILGTPVNLGTVLSFLPNPPAKLPL